VVVGEYGLRDHQCRREAVIALDDDGQLICRGHFEGGELGPTGDGMRIFAL
jgi:hypothetical protein